MPLVDMHDMLNHAYQNNYAVGGFNLVSYDFLRAILDAAELCRSPVVLSLAEADFKPDDFELMMTATERAARRAAIPVAIHLDHGSSSESAVNAINLGCNSVMVDCPDETFAVKVSSTRQVVDIAHRCGVSVEGELGYVACIQDNDTTDHADEAVYTSVAEATAYAERTGIDSLAVSIGTAHGRMRGRPRLDIDRLRRINSALGLPLVIHGGSGLTEDQYRRLIACGVAKINYYTALSDIAGKCIRENARVGTKNDYTGLVNQVRGRIFAEVERCMHIWGSAGRAAEILVQCRPWQPVHHVMLYNIEYGSEAQTEAVITQGKEVLARIPGVRRVISGWATSEQPSYRFCWLVELAHEKVLESYRGHPDHVAFENRLFRPIASDRVSLEFAETDVASVIHTPALLRQVLG
jgi:fructose-bisphosphate aldolase class II